MKFLSKKHLPIFIGVVLTIAIFTCKKKATSQDTSQTGPVASANYTSDYKYNLNVIYFVPKDVAPNPDWEERISKILIAGQAYYQTWMKYWGFGEKTFGLLKNKENTRIKIHMIKAPLNAASYTNYEPMEELVRDYFKQNPKALTSDHYLVLSATNKKLDQGEEIGHEVPYYGVDRWCYAIEYPNMKYENLGAAGKVGETATISIGGLLHELGHGINLSHNGPTKSQLQNPSFGMTLMGAGNYTYGKAPTFLSFYDAVILNNCQIFSKETKEFYGSVTTSITSIVGKFENNEIVLSGKFISSAPVKHVSVVNTAETDPQGYESITSTTIHRGDNSFVIKIPISEFITTANSSYTLEIVFHHGNGTNTSKYYNYRFVNNQPTIDFSDRVLLSRKNWTIVDYSSQQSSAYSADNVLDDNENTYWMTSWDIPKAHPHHISIKTGNVTAKGIGINTRQDTSSGDGKIKKFKVEISQDNINWTEAYAGTMALNGTQFFTFDSPKTFMYFRVRSLNDYEGKKLASLSEVNLF